MRNIQNPYRWVNSKIRSKLLARYSKSWFYLGSHNLYNYYAANKTTMCTRCDVECTYIISIFAFVVWCYIGTIRIWESECVTGGGVGMLGAIGGEHSLFGGFFLFNVNFTHAWVNPKQIVVTVPWWLWLLALGDPFIMHVKKA